MSLSTLFKGAPPTNLKRKKNKAAKQSSTTSSITQKKQKQEQTEGWLLARSMKEITGPAIVIAWCEGRLCAIAASMHTGLYLHKIDEEWKEKPLNEYYPTGIEHVLTLHQTDEAQQMLTMKTAHGKYVGTDKFGIVGVEREAVGLQEGWNFEVLPEESPLDTEEIKEVHKLNHGPSATPSFARFALKSCNGWYLGVKWDESRNRGIIRADGDHVSALAGETQEVPKSKLKGGANLATESTSGSWFYILIQAQVRAKLNYVEVVTEKGVGDLETEESKKYQSWSTSLRGRDRDGASLAASELVQAKEEGRLAEAMLDRRVKKKSDKFC